MNFEANISFTDDTSALAITATADPGSPTNIGTGVTSCTSSLFPGVVEGNHARYKLRVQQWNDGATTCALPDAQTNGDLPAVSFTAPSPTGNAGCWVDMASGTSDMYGSQTLPDVLGLGLNGPSAPPNGTVSGILSVPATLTQIATFVRYVVSVEEGDTRVPNDTTVSFWSQLQAGNPNQTTCNAYGNPPFIPSFPPNEIPATGEGYACYSGCFGCGFGMGLDPHGPIYTQAIAPFCPPAVPNGVNEGPNARWTIFRPGVPSGTTGGFNYEQALNPFLVVLEPVGVAQLKVLPWTILYAAPGDKSSTSYAITQSYGTNMTTTNLLNQSQSTGVDSKTTDGSSTSTGMMTLSYNNITKIVPSLAAGGSVGAFLTDSNFTITGMTSSSTTWDNSTTFGSGRSSQAATSQAANLQVVVTDTIAKMGNTGLVPGAAGTYGQEPFWGDTLLLLIHPQIGIWQANGIGSIVLLGAQSGGLSGFSVPNLFAVTILELQECATQAPGFENGLKIKGSTHTPLDATDVLTAADCQQLLPLDPLYPVGQTLPTAPNARMVLVTTQSYGTNGTVGADGSHSDQNVSLAEVLTYTNVTTATNVASYNSVATNVFTTMNSTSGSLGAYGFSVGSNSSQSNSMTGTTNWMVQYQSSFAATAQSSTGVTGVLDDDHVFPTKPAAFIYQDTAFGTFIFQDRDAPPQPAQ